MPTNEQARCGKCSACYLNTGPCTSSQHADPFNNGQPLDPLDNLHPRRINGHDSRCPAAHGGTNCTCEQVPAATEALGDPLNICMTAMGRQRIDAAAEALSCAMAWGRFGQEREPKLARALSGLRAMQSLAAPTTAAAGVVEPLQPRVQPWLMECFGLLIAGDREERNHRFIEEALELVQACGCSASEAHQLVDYVFGRPVGEPGQEVGGTMITLAALCLANDLDMHAEGERELARITQPEMVLKIRAKQAAKPKHSPLPGPGSAPDDSPLETGEGDAR